MRVVSLTVALLLLSDSSHSSAQEAVRPPCGGLPLPSYFALGKPPRIRSVQVAGGTAPGCADWTSARSTLLMAVAGSSEQDGGADALLATFGRISTLAGMRYWSVIDHGWRALVTSAAALKGPDSAQRRRDFTPAEMAEGSSLNFVQADSPSGAGWFASRRRGGDSMASRGGRAAGSYAKATSTRHARVSRPKGLSMTSLPGGRSVPA